MQQPPQDPHQQPVIQPPAYYPPPQQPYNQPYNERSYQTVPQGPQPPYGPPPTPPKKKAKPWLIGGGIGCLILVLCSCASVLAVSLSPRNSTTSALDLPTDTVFVVPTAIPTATLSTSAAVTTYLNVVHTNSVTLSSDFDTVSTLCGNMVTADDVASCRAALETAQVDAGNFLAQLLIMNVPSCLQQANVKLQDSLGQVGVATSEMIVGIDNTDANEVVQGAHDMNTASATLGQANTLMKQAKCS